MPADLEACVKAMEGKADSPWALCQWMRTEGKGFFAHGGATDLDAAAREFRDGAGPLVEPPVVIGHEEDQPLLHNTGIPAVGWVVGLRRRGTKLYADLSQIFPSVARLIEAGAYRHVSPEIYPRDRPPEGVPAKGCMLRRLAILGGQLPHVKSLADLPPPGAREDLVPDVEIFEAGEWQGETYTVADLDDMVANFDRFSRPARRYAERARLRPPPRRRLTRGRRVWQAGAGTWACFSEVAAMADNNLREAAVAAVKAAHPDLSDEFLQSLSDEQLAMLATPATPEETPPPEGAAPMQEGDCPDPQQMIGELSSMGEDPTALAGMDPAALCDLYRSKKGAPMSEPDDLDALAEPGQTPCPACVAAPRGRAPKKVTRTEQFAEARQVAALRREIAGLQRDVAEERRLRRQRAGEERHGLIRSFCERMVKEGRATPAETEHGKDGKPVGPLAKSLHAADAVQKFSDGKTALALAMEAVEARQPRKYGEQVADPLQQQGGRQLSAERRQQLLALTPRGKSVLAQEEGQQKAARAFGEALGQVLGVKLNGRG